MLANVPYFVSGGGCKCRRHCRKLTNEEAIRHIKTNELGHQPEQTERYDMAIILVVDVRYVDSECVPVEETAQRW
jgi:hypothetical protein